MFSLLISAIVTIAVVSACQAAEVKSGTTAYGILSFLATFYLVGFFVRKRIKKTQNQLQEMLVEGQQRISRKLQQAQSKPGVNVKLLQRQLESDQQAVIQEALKFTEQLEPFKKWSLLMSRQIATMRMQFLYQLKEFDQVDELLDSQGLFKGPMMLEAMTVAMKMARQYKHGDIAGAEKTYKRKIKWFRGSRGNLLYGLMSWIQVKEGKYEEARELLLKAKEKTGNETLTFNWERLSNDKPKNFSNAGLGEEWYGLYLEKPPQPKQQRARAQKGRRPF